ncbi:MAG: glycoside hydrolase family 25 protein [Lachnospiraceae bacterium]|nr:glycoside hydrolase family 25 protein [Lachnospiraceae bacterium]
MRLPDGYEERGKMSPVLATAFGTACIFILLIIVIVLFVNKEDKPASNTANSGKRPETEYQEEVVQNGTISPDDFDFWDMYPQATEAPVEITPQPPVEEDPSEDGKHTKVINDLGEEEWIKINTKLEKNEYDFTKLVSQSQLMQYYKDGKECSFVGVDISKYQEYIDFNKVKKAGIDFCMVRVGARGYGTGALVLDEYFHENMKRATDAGLSLGVYFFSQAITEEEAIEEANMVLEQIEAYNVTYPVAFDMEYIENDKARVEQLTKKEKTAIAKAFLDTIGAAGYTPIIYGKKEWLLLKLDLTKLTDYDVWLAQYEDIPEYPYKFSMWQYTNQGTVDGISGKVDLNISFIDFSEK